MSYRRKGRDAESVEEWRNWRKQHSALITATALPAYVFDTEHWDLFLEYGFLMESGADLKEMTVKQKVALLRLIMTRPIDLESHVGHLLVLTLLDTLEYAMEQGYFQ